MSTIIIQGLKSNKMVTQGYFGGVATVAVRKAYATLQRLGRAFATLRRT